MAAMCGRFSKGCKWAYLIFHLKECCHGTTREVSFCLFVCLFVCFLRCTFLVPTLKNTALIFLEIFFIQCFMVQVRNIKTEIGNLSTDDEMARRRRPEVTFSRLSDLRMYEVVKTSSSLRRRLNLSSFPFW